MVYNEFQVHWEDDGLYLIWFELFPTINTTCFLHLDAHVDILNMTQYDIDFVKIVNFEISQNQIYISKSTSISISILISPKTYLGLVDIKNHTLMSQSQKAKTTRKYEKPMRPIHT